MYMCVCVCLQTREDSMATSYSEPLEVNLKKAISQNWHGKFEGLTLVLLLAVMSAVFGSSTQFGFNTGVINKQLVFG